MKNVVLITVLLFCFSAAMPISTFSQGTGLPSVMVKTLDGKSQNIQEFPKMGRMTVVLFWETFCNPSIKGLDNISDVYEDWQKKYNCDLIAVSVDDARNVSKIRPLVNGKDWPYLVLSDINKDLMRALNIPNCPYVILLNKQGNIVYSHNGFPEGFEAELEEQVKKFSK